MKIPETLINEKKMKHSKYMFNVSSILCLVISAGFLIYPITMEILFARAPAGNFSSGALICLALSAIASLHSRVIEYGYYIYTKSNNYAVEE